MIRIGIVGAGGMGNVHARHYRRLPEVEVLVFDPDPEKSGRLVAAHGGSVIESLDQLFELVDALDLCVPNDVHADLALRAIERGRPLLIEKPLAHSVEAGRAIVEAAEAGGVPVAVGHVVRFFPEYERGHQLVKSGRVGRVAAVRMRRGGGVPRAAWFLDHARSGGVLVDLAIHEFDWLLWTLGPVQHLYARSVGAKTWLGPDYGLCTLTFSSGAVAHVEATWMDPGGFRTEFEVCGSEGMLQYDSRRAASVRWHEEGAVRGESPMAWEDDPYFRQLRAFVAMLEAGAPPAVSGREGLAALELAFAAQTSAREDRVVELCAPGDTQKA